jgi:hypothetical protein
MMNCVLKCQRTVKDIAMHTSHHCLLYKTQANTQFYVTSMFLGLQKSNLVLYLLDYGTV